MEATGARQRKWPPLQAIKTLLKNYVLVIAVSAALALFVRTFVLEAFFIPSAYMSPNLKPGDHIFVYKLAYKLGSESMPSRGDVVIFTFPNEPYKEYIKRVIGIPGDRIAIQSGKVFLNSEPISQLINREISSNNTNTSADFFEETLGTHKFIAAWKELDPESRKMIEVTVPQDRVFVLSDNRATGHDSRVWGFLPTDYIKGKAVWVWFSEERSRMFSKVP